MELIELDATAQRALELLTNAGMSDGNIYDYLVCSNPIVLYMPIMLFRSFCW